MDNNKNNINEKYLDSIHRLGRFGSIGAICFMIGIPLFMSFVYNSWPDLKVVLKSSIGLLVLFLPIAVSEVISYMPILGSASYISYITGNVMNLKLPCAINAIKIGEVKQGTQDGDVFATIAVAISSITTMLIIALGVVLIVPLQPVLNNPNVQTATKYMLPALFGGMLTPMLLDNTIGEYKVKNKLLPILPIMIAILLINKFILPLAGFEGIALILTIPISILIARFLYKKGIIKATKIE